jgi:hypothetical protein
LDQKVRGWFGSLQRDPTRTTFPPVDRVGLRDLPSGKRNVVTPDHPPKNIGQADRKAG